MLTTVLERTLRGWQWGTWSISDWEPLNRHRDKDLLSGGIGMHQPASRSRSNWVSHTLLLTVLGSLEGWKHLPLSISTVHTCYHLYRRESQLLKPRANSCTYHRPRREMSFRRKHVPAFPNGVTAGRNVIKHGVARMLSSSSDNHTCFQSSFFLSPIDIFLYPWHQEFEQPSQRKPITDPS